MLVKEYSLKEKIYIMGLIGVCIYGSSVVVKRNILNIGLGIMVLSSLFFVKNFSLKKIDKIQKLFLILIIVTPLFDIFSPGGVTSALISIQKSYRFLPIFLAPIFLINYDKIKKFIFFVNLSVLFNCFYVLNVYRKLNWDFNIRYETLNGVQDTSHCLVGLSYIVLCLMILSYKERNKLMILFSSFTYIFSIFIIFISKTRGAWLALIFSMIFLIILLFDKKVIKYLLVLGSLIIVLGITNREKLEKNIYYQRVMSIKDTKSASPRIRLMFWKASYDIYKENWLFGVGKDNSPQYFIDYFKKNKEFVDENLLTEGNKEELFYIAEAGNPHSMYFDNLVNMGIFFFYWVWMMVYIFFLQLKESIILKINNKESKKFIITVCSLCLTIAFAVTGSLGTAWDDFLQRHVFLIGLILFISISKLQDEKDIKEEI